MTKTSHSRPNFTPWIVVAILWVIAMLNYLDRLMITTMRTSIIADIPMTDAQFGMLTSIFLWIYGCVSPLGGYLADRLGRRWMIIASLVIWSAVTWLSGHAQTFNQLLWARAIMGISEACYIPAALALISDHHRGRTRSLATGLHQSGIYMGAALGGIGGYIAEAYGWRIGFSLFGIFGVVYGVVALAFLREAPAQVSTSGGNSPPFNFINVSKSVFSHGSFWLLIVLNIFVSIANWMIYGWLPTYLKEHFNLGQGAAGISATLYIQIASFAGILIGGAWADRWGVANPRARAYVTAIGFAAAAPALFLTGSSSIFLFAIFGLVFFGLGRGFYDANLMPILRQVIDERYSATGYGILNCVGCLVGGAMTYAGGAMRDAHVPMGIIFQSAAAGLAVTCGLLFLLRFRPAGSASQSEPEGINAEPSRFP